MGGASKNPYWTRVQFLGNINLFCNENLSSLFSEKGGTAARIKESDPLINRALRSMKKFDKLIEGHLATEQFWQSRVRHGKIVLGNL